MTGLLMALLFSVFFGLTIWVFIIMGIGEVTNVVLITLLLPLVVALVAAFFLCILFIRSARSGHN